MTTAPPHEILIAPNYGQDGRQEIWDQCYKVRVDVFHHEQGFPLDTEMDDLEDVTVHILLRLVPSLTPVGTIRAYKTEGARYYKLSRLAVLKEYRQYKFGRALVLALHSWAQEDAKRTGNKNFIDVIAHSQIPVKAFYAKFGYVPQGDEFDEDGAPHQKMVARLPVSM